MSGTLGLTTPWARRAITAENRVLVETALPDGLTVGVSVDANHAFWILWRVDENRVRASKLKVSTRLSLVDACWFALRHWGIAENAA